MYINTCSDLFPVVLHSTPTQLNSALLYPTLLHYPALLLYFTLHHTTLFCSTVSSPASLYFIVPTVLYSVFFFYFILFIYSILLGRIYCPEGKGTTGLQGPLQGAPPHPPPFHIRKTATAPGSPYSYTNSAWVL